MKPLLLSALILLMSINTKAQNLPYLNASSGNVGEFVVDADSNIYMFNGSILKKLDKNFNSIWINNYPNISFRNLLLSKNKSIYFVGTNLASGDGLIGKLNASGSTDWCKTLPSFTATVGSNTQTVLPPSADKMFLDRNNHLIVTGATQLSGADAYFLKLDTLGNFIKLRTFSNLYCTDIKQSMVLNDINGIYTISSIGYGYGGGGSYSFSNLFYKYNDLTDLVTSDPISSIGYVNSTHNISNQGIFKSKTNANAFYTTISNSSSSSLLNNTFSLRKITDTTHIWNVQFQTLSPYLLGVLNIEEDHLKNTLVTFGSVNINTSKSTAWALKIDSNGVTDNKRIDLVQYHIPMPASGDTIVRLMHHYDNNYFCSIESTSSGALTMVKMDSTIGSYCTTPVTLTITSTNNSFSSLGQVATTVTAVPSVTMTVVPSTVTSISNFSVVINNCLPLGTKDLDSQNAISLYPNPTRDFLNINTSANSWVNQLTIFDITGKQVLSNTNKASIDVSKLNSGLYFIKVKTDQGEFSRKFIKE